MWDLVEKQKNSQAVLVQIETSGLAPQALGRSRAFSLVRLSDLSNAGLLKTVHRHWESFSTISFIGPQHDAGGGGFTACMYF